MSIVCLPPGSPRDLLLSVGGDARVVASLREAAVVLDRDPGETLVIIGAEVASHEALAFAAMLQLDRPAVGVILVREETGSDVLTQALQSGVREVVPAHDHVAMVSACQRSLSISRRILGGSHDGTGPQGQIITVFSAKGGAGKTTMALNLGAVLAKSSRRRVCVVDLDLGFGDVAVSVGLDSQRTIVEAAGMDGHLDSYAAGLLLTPYQARLDVLLAPPGPADAEKVSPQLVGELLTVLRGMFGYVVVDTPPAFNEHVLTALDASDHHVLVTTPEVPALKNLRVAMDTMDLLSYPKQIRSVVLNRASSKVGLSAKEIERVVQFPITAHIPSSRAVPLSFNKGIPIAVDRPGHAVSRAIAGFAQELQSAPVREGRRAVTVPGGMEVPV